MRKLVLKMSMSLDGHVAGMRAESDWMFRASTPDSAAWVLDTVAGAGVHVFGRRTFESIAGYWANASTPIAAVMNAIPKVVVTRNPGFDPSAIDLGDSPDAAAVTWSGARVASGDLAEEIVRLRADDAGGASDTGGASDDHPGYLLAQGGTDLCRSLVRAGLVDEYRLVVLPVALGSGAGIFDGLEHELDLELVSSTAFAGGAKAEVYRPRS
ncbi:dihydrofolate reductase family protein [Curtobacterium pusillum]|uniref:dihydrofolate reductase family protein n=1 Tax=Curtobacterium pusillum TaxID=69373 RepID=UPI0011A4B005|nr:dihydrofolate reductase family protein [Curtobacterium pusillum]